MKKSGSRSRARRSGPISSPDSPQCHWEGAGQAPLFDDIQASGEDHEGCWASDREQPLRVRGPQDTLLLDISYQPLRVISWQKAFCMGLTQRVEVISDHDRPIRTVDNEYPAPAVVRLLTPRRPQEYVLRFSRLAIYRRDGFVCQYCRRKFRRDQLTLDHVVPRHLGGGMSWTNIVAACRACNARKGGRRLADTRLRLLRPPVRPRWKPLSVQSVGGPVPTAWRPWLLDRTVETAV